MAMVCGVDSEAQKQRLLEYDLPYQTEDYIHRIGRTGRAGASGEAVSFVAKNDFKNICAIESRLGTYYCAKRIRGL